MRGGWFGRDRARRDAELEEEISAHLRMAEADRLAAGASPASAAADVRREFGNVGRVKELTRETWGGLWWERLVQDLGFGWRVLRRNPGFTVLAVLCLTVGIGANAAVFGWIEGILFRPYPAVADQERLVALANTVPGEPHPDEVSWPDLLDLERSCTSCESVIADKITGTTLSTGDRAERISGSIVSANYFAALGVAPLLGRGFEPTENQGRNAHPVTVISYQLWQERFGGDPRVLGRTQKINGVPFTIVGVAPRGFYGTFVGYAFQFWVPVSMQERLDSTGYKLEDRSARWIEGYVRLKRGVTLARAQAEVSAIAKRLGVDYPEADRGRGFALLPLWRSPFNNAGALMPTLRIALAVVVVVLLIACANVSNLLLVKSLGRHHEMTVRLAVGAGSGRLLRQLLTEASVLALFAAGGGVAIAYALRRALVLLIPPRGVAMNITGTIDWRVLVASIGLGLLATLLFGLAPALQAARIDLATVLRSEAGSVVGGRAKPRLRSLLVLVQVSLSFMLLVGAGLLIESMQRIRNASPGFSTRHLLVTAVDLLSAGYEAGRARPLQEELMRRVLALPGVTSAAYSRIAPFSFRTYSSAPLAVVGFEPAPDERPEASYNEIGPGYFSTLGIPLLAGREFTRADDDSAPLVAVVNDTMAAKYWRGGDPVGKLVRAGDRWLRVVGVARTARYRTFLETPQPFFYVPLAQSPSVLVSLAIRTTLAPRTMAAALLPVVHGLDPDLAPGEVITMREQLERSTAAQRIAVTLLAGFGSLALLLAAVGLYGVMSYTVSQTARELGLRTALGAGAPDLLRLVLSRGLGLTASGLAVGAAAALATTWLLGYLLFEVSPRDPLVFTSALALMTAVALAACLSPARRAARTQPVRALRD